MEITKILLNDLGADPKVYSDNERAHIGEMADRIIGGELSALLSECTLPEEKLESLKKSYGEARDSLMADMREVARLAEEIAGVFSRKSTVFTASLSPEERDRLLVKGTRFSIRISELREDMLDKISVIYSGMTALYELQNLYNKTLAELGMISIAAKAAEGAGKEYDEDAIMTPILDAYEKLTSLTEFINDLKDKSVIYEKASEISLGNLLDSLAVHMDLMKDGEGLNVTSIMNDTAAIKRVAEDVLKTHL